VRALERTRMPYRLHVYAFVVMPEHVHLLLSEPERGTIANAIQSLKILPQSAVGCLRFASRFWTLTWDYCTLGEERYRFSSCPAVKPLRC
jgi:putative transposase